MPQTKNQFCLVKWYVISFKVILEPVLDILFIFFAPLNVCHDPLFSLLLGPRSWTSRVIFVELFQLKQNNNK